MLLEGLGACSSARPAPEPRSESETSSPRWREGSLQGYSGRDHILGILQGGSPGNTGEHSPRGKLRQGQDGVLCGGFLGLSNHKQPKVAALPRSPGGHGVRSGCRQGWLLPEALGGKLPLPLPWLQCHLQSWASLACSRVTQVSAFSSHVLCHAACANPLLVPSCEDSATIRSLPPPRDLTFAPPAETLLPRAARLTAPG